MLHSVCEFFECIARDRRSIARQGMDVLISKLVIAAVVGLAAIVVMCEPIQAEPLTVGAPPSLRAALQEIVPLFEQEYRAAAPLGSWHRRLSSL